MAREHFNQAIKVEQRKDDIKTIDAYLGRFGIGIDDVVPVDKLMTALEVNTTNSYPFIAEAKFADPGSGDNRFMAAKLAFEHTFGRTTLPNGEKDKSSTLLIMTELEKQLVENPNIGEEGARKMLAYLTNLMQFANHDFTAHEIGNLDRVTPVSDALRQTIDYTTLPAQSRIEPFERVAGLLQRVLFEKACAASPLLRRFTLLQATRAADIVGRLPEAEQGKWLSVLKYPVYSLFDPESKEMKALREKFTTDGKARFEPGPWASYVHQHEIPLKKGGVITDRQLVERIYPRPRTDTAPDIAKDIQKGRKRWHHRFTAP